MFFFKFIMAGEKSRPPKPLQKIPVGSQAHRALNCLPKADELFIATELACESTFFLMLSLLDSASPSTPKLYPQLTKSMPSNTR